MWHVFVCPTQLYARTRMSFINHTFRLTCDIMKTNPLSGQCYHFISRSLNKTSSGGMKTKLLLLLKQEKLFAGALPAKRERRRIANLEKIITCQFRYFSGSKEQYSEEKNKKKIQNHGPNHVANHGSVEDCLTPSEAGKRAHRLRNDQDCNKSPLLGRMGMDTLLSHAGLTAWRKSNNKNGTKDHQDDNTSNMTLHSWNEPLCPPLHLETTYTRPPSGDYFNPQDGGNGWVYSRIGNPTRKLLEDCMSRLEIITSRTKVMQGIVGNASRGEHALKENNDWSNDDDAASGITCAFSSGMAAVGAILLALPQRLHVVLPNDIYHGVPTQLKTMFVQRNVTYSTIDMTNIENVQCAIQQFMQSRDDENTSDNPPHLLVWMESPSNPQCKVVDIKAICDYVSKCKEVDRRHGITTVVDSTWAPPPITQPLLLGADVVMHSGTKYLGGHSDVLLGVVTVSPFTCQGKALKSSIRAIQTTLGATASPFDCWLTLRGLRTLHLRIERQSKTAMQLASYLASHELVQKVHYPGLVTHPQYDVASRQMQGGCYGGMLSFEMESEAMAMAVAGAVSTIQRGTSLGGTETLIEHRASIEPEDGRVSPKGLLRVSVGLEDFQGVKEDLRQAIDIAQKVMTVNPLQKRD